MSLEIGLKAFAFLERRLEDKTLFFPFTAENVEEGELLISVKDEEFHLMREPDEKGKYTIQCSPSKEIMVAFSMVLVTMNPYLPYWLRDIDNNDFYDLLNPFVKDEVKGVVGNFTPSRTLNYCFRPEPNETVSLSWAIQKMENAFRYDLKEFIKALKDEFVDSLRNVLSVK